MARLPFDPAKMLHAREPAEAKPQPATTPAQASLSVSQLAALIGQAIDGTFAGPVRVVGEVSNFNHRTHWYFAIKDAGSVLNCVMFAGRARAAGFTPEQGQQVLLTATIEFYEPQGKLTLNVEKIEPVGAGALELQLKKLVEELRQLGWLEAARKRPLPILPRRVAVITSRKGAALQDVLDTMRKRCPAVDVALIDVLVQGPAAAPAIAQAIDWASQHAAELSLDALLLTRGGGSIEDLWAFNERDVARAIVGCSIPVVAAIGHETDTTIAELVADLRCATPTQAAMAITPDASALARQLIATGKRLTLLAKRTLSASREQRASTHATLTASTKARLALLHRRLDQSAVRLERCRPASVYARRQSAIAQLATRLRAAVRQHLRDRQRQTATTSAELTTTYTHARARTRNHLAGMARQLQLVGPEQVLQRGYSITLSKEGQVVRTPADVAPGQQMLTRLAEGEITSVVGTTLLVPLPRPRRKKPSPEPGPGLFGAQEGGDALGLR
ncbi:MAG: exodeoxyribonuclease VII large subunit [bacterium]